jgi:thiol-disulfide isomerase/thioredoxin
MNKLLRNVLLKALLALTVPLHVAAASAEEKIRPLEPDSFRQIVASEQGKPFVVMIWSLDCDYCQPSFHALADAKRKSGLTVITIATDRADDPETSRLIRKKLEASGLGAQIWAFGTAPAEQLRYSIDPKWRGELPRSYWFSSRGEALPHSGLITADTVARLLPR